MRAASSRARDIREVVSIHRYMPCRPGVLELWRAVYAAAVADYPTRLSLAELNAWRGTPTWHWCCAALGLDDAIAYRIITDPELRRRARAYFARWGHRAWTANTMVLAQRRTPRRRKLGPHRIAMHAASLAKRYLRYATATYRDGQVPTSLRLYAGSIGERYAPVLAEARRILDRLVRAGRVTRKRLRTYVYYIERR